MKRIATAIILLASTPALAQTPLFKCVGADGVPTYLSKRMAGATCEIISVSHEPRWHHVVTSTTGDLVRVDLETVLRTGSTVTAWVQYIHMKEQPYVPNEGRAFTTVQRESFDCRAMSGKVHAQILYDESRKVLRELDSPAASYRSIAPETLSEAVWQWACLPAG